MDEHVANPNRNIYLFCLGGMETPEMFEVGFEEHKTHI